MRTFYYTYTYSGDSNALDSIYLDEVSGILAFLFHNETVTFRWYDGGKDGLNSLLASYGGSMGRLWNSSFKNRLDGMDNSSLDAVFFVRRAEIPVKETVAAEDIEVETLYDVTITVKVSWDEIQEIIETLANQGFTGSVEAAVRSE